MQDHKMRVLCLCNTAQTEKAVLEVLRGYKKPSFDFVKIDTPLGFQSKTLHGKFDAGLVDFDSMPKNEAEQSRVLEGLGARLALVLLISKKKEKHAFKTLNAGLVRDYVVLSNGKSRNHLLHCSQWHCGVVR